ncbi:hypothetical protein QC763_111888 [Podospora pseudopauciseta]|uniref:Uncharacterized protein n=1 Tax=Podospora pseudopauciseta TaxID=2093780 RepID=A0ABR0HZA0_9PEZI|nr:hypothetical protein QC763_111888 [Podospora pseudopauciseta]
MAYNIMTQQSCSDLVNHHEQEPFYEVKKGTSSSSSNSSGSNEFPTKPYHAPYVTSYNHPHITIHTHYPTIDHKHDTTTLTNNHSHTTTPTQPLPHNHSLTTTPTQPLSHVPALLHIEPNTTTTNTSRYHDTPFSILNRFPSPKQSHYPA